MNLNQITIQSKDLIKSVQFYKSIGLILIVDAMPNYVRFELPEGDATFSVQRVEQLPTTTAVSIYFENSNLDALVDSLISKGVSFDTLPEDKRWGWREAHLSDPDGHQLVLYSAGVNRKNPPWRVN